MVVDFFKKANFYLEKIMPLLTPTGVVLGLLLGDKVSHFAPAVTFLFAFMTFTGALSINAKDFIHVIKKPFPIFLFLFTSHVIMPCLGFFVGKIIFPHDTAIVTGIVLLFSIPTAVASSIWASIHQGNLSLTISILLVDTLLAPFLTPLTVSLFMGTTVEIDGIGMLLSLVWMVVIPSIIGVAINQFSKGKIPAIITPYCKPVSKLTLLMVIIINSSRIRGKIDHFEGIFIITGLTCLILSFLGFAMGSFNGKLLKLKREDSVSLMYGTGMRNISAALVLAITYFEARTAIPVVFGIVFQQTLAALSGIILLPKKQEIDTE
ncbi:MAG: bile acid:sodium symporter family protein [Spirochaetaceae bacterium]|nr:bile acid:sodium symporter family protein [Spirochaetaceae bacterium]